MCTKSHYFRFKRTFQVQYDLKLYKQYVRHVKFNNFDLSRFVDPGV